MVTKAITEAKLQFATAVLLIIAIPISGFFLKNFHNQLQENTKAQEENKLRDAELMNSIKLLRVEMEYRIKALENELERGN